MSRFVDAAFRLAAATGAVYQPPELAPAWGRCADAAPLLAKDASIRIFCWNIQFCGGRGASFFYDGGPRVRVPPDEVEATLAAVIAAIQAADADIVLLQEVDRGSDRTGRVDQLARIAAATGYAAWFSAPYHRVAYVPYPPGEPLGRVDLHLAVLSRFRVGAAARVALPLLAEPAWRQAFNLRRAILDLRLPIAEGGELAVLNTHLSAFSLGDGTLSRQVTRLGAHLDGLDAAGRPWLLAGDFNCLPPGDRPERLAPGDRALYAEAESPVAPLFVRSAAPVTPEALTAAPGRFGTYVPIGHAGADRTIDYLFARGARWEAAEVMQGLGDVSDHLPWLGRLRVP